MCVTSAPARLSATSVSLSRFRDFDVLGYSNTAENRADGPNILVLHVPSEMPLTRESFIKHQCPNLHKDMKTAITPVTRGFSFGAVAEEKVLVFDHDIYTIVAPQRMSSIDDIVAALAQVPEEKRPALNRALFDYYATKLSQFSVAFCCFNNRQKQEAMPLLVKYVPRWESIMSLPAIDCHTGGIPQYGLVDVDHHVFLYHHKMKYGEMVTYTDPKAGEIKAYLPPKVIGTYVGGMKENGDFVVSTSDVLLSYDLNPSVIKRSMPADYPA